MQPLLDPDHFPLTHKSRNLVRFCRHLGHETLDDAFACDFALRAGLSRFSIFKNPRTAPGPDECFAHIQIDARLLFDKLLNGVSPNGA